MKFIHTGDWHIKLYSDNEYDDTGIPRKLNEIYNNISNLCQYAYNNNISQVIISGDINDTKGIVHVRPWVLLQRILSNFSNLDFIFLHGNHDSSSYINKESAINLLDGPKNISTITDTTIINDLTFIPYSKHIIDEINKTKSNKFLISHFGLNEAQLSSGISLKTSITLNDVKKFDRVLLGHYHIPSNIGNVYYCGSLIQLRKDEKNEEKRFLVVDSDTLEIESIPTINYRKYYEFVIDKEYEDNSNKLKELLNEVADLKSQGHYVSIKNQLKILPKISKKLLNDVNIIDDYEEEYQLRGITTAMGDKEQMKKYLEIERIPEDEYNEYLNIGLEVLEKGLIK